uniref:Uncharacterized protein n=1 Tax=Daucus carota subsp. sativus TaxID=79200 RepID=A0A166GEK7_DAUCS
MSLVLLHRRETKEDFHLQVSLRRSSLLFGCEAVSNQNTQQRLALPEKEVIQPHLPVRLPCYDFTPVTSPAFGIPLLAVKDLTQHLMARANDSHAPPLSAFPKAPLSFKRIRGMSNPGGILNALATTLHGLIRTAPSIHRLRLGLLGYLIPFATLDFISQYTDAYSPDTVIASSQGKEVHDPWAFYLHAALLRQAFAHCGKFPSPDNACILCITAAAGTELADAYSPDTVIASSPGKEVHDPWAFYLHAALLRQAFAHCGKFPTAASRRSLGRVSVPVWLIILSDQLLIIALPFPAVVPLPRAGSYALLTRPPLKTLLPV